MCADSYSVSVPPPVLPQWQVKTPVILQKLWVAGYTKHAPPPTLDPSKSEWADYATVQEECGNLSGNEFTCNSSRNTRSQSSQLAEPLWTDPGLKSRISLRELISTLKRKEKKKAQAGNELSNILPKSSHTRKKPPPPVPCHQLIPNTGESSTELCSDIHLPLCVL